MDVYEGQVFLREVVREFVKAYHDKKEFHEYKRRLFNALSRTGVVTGEYGFVNAYKHKKDEIKVWQKEADTVVKEFAKEYETYLNKLIAQEQKRADEEIELMKREFDD